MALQHPHQGREPDRIRSNEAHGHSLLAIMEPGGRAERGDRRENRRRHPPPGPEVDRRRRIHRSGKAQDRVVRSEPLICPGLHAVWFWMLQRVFRIADQTPALAPVAPAEQRTQGADLPRLCLGFEQTSFIGEAVEWQRAKVLAQTGEELPDLRVGTLNIEERPGALHLTSVAVWLLFERKQSEVFDEVRQARPGQCLVGPANADARTAR